MTHIPEYLSMLGLIINYDQVELTSLVSSWSQYADLSAILAMALMTSLCYDQLSLLRGKFSPQPQESVVSSKRLVNQPIRQFLKYQFLGSTDKDTIHLAGADKIGGFRFFFYNLCSTVIWLCAIISAGVGLRYLLVSNYGTFGPIEFEIITGILAVYVAGLAVIISARINPKHQERRTYRKKGLKP